MAKWAADVYVTPAALEAAVEAIDTTTTIHVIAYTQDGRQKFMVIKSA